MSLEGDFVFDTHRDFRQAYETAMAQPGVEVIEVDLAGVGYVDSSALGMLLLLREKLDTLGVRVRLSGVQGVVRQVLDVANFGASFEIRNSTLG